MFVICVLFDDSHSDRCGVTFPCGFDVHFLDVSRGFRGGSVVESAPAKAGDAGCEGSIPGSGRSPGGGNVHPLQYACLENPVDRRAWRATVHRVAKSWTSQQPLVKGEINPGTSHPYLQCWIFWEDDGGLLS